MESEFKYKAFISYSHKDEKWARWLHRRLEQYRFPKNILDVGAKSETSPPHIRPIFRDREELSAGSDLGVKIETALLNSENLIIICSPHAAQSYWVNQEIIFFHRQNRSGQIFCIIVAGEPFATNKPDHEAKECLPSGLRFEIDLSGELTGKELEPLAADLRPGKDGKRLGLLKLISGIAKLELDDLVQRDIQRRMRRVMAVTVGACTGMLAMGVMTYIALQSRTNAIEQRAVAVEQRAEADRQRAEAEELVSFMLNDLRPLLRKSVRGVDVLKSVNKKITAYYDGESDLNRLPIESLQLRAYLIYADGQDAEDSGDADLAFEKYWEFNKISKSLLERDPNNSQRMFTHADSENRLGLHFFNIEAFDKAVPHLSNAEALLVKISPDDLALGVWSRLAAQVYGNKCAVTLKSKSDASTALENCQKAVIYNRQFISEIVSHPGTQYNHDADYNMVFHFLWLSEAWQDVGHKINAEIAAQAYLDLSRAMVEREPGNLFWLGQRVEVLNFRAKHLENESLQLLTEAKSIQEDLLSQDQSENDNNMNDEEMPKKPKRRHRK